ncbi:MAG: PQQ-binding-like beta-propeller repeat protein [Zavarzinella sp.]
MRYMLCSLLIAAGGMWVSAADWPQFRGPEGNGIYTGPALPSKWGIDTNVAWVTKVSGSGWSSPIIWNGQVYLTTAVNTDQSLSLRAISFDQKSGKQVLDELLFEIPTGKTARIHSKNSHASSTACAAGDSIVFHFGHNGTACLDKTGKIVWKREGLYQRPVHGNGGSPIIVNEKVIFSCDAADVQKVVALDLKSGKTVWETPRSVKAGRTFSFSTPTVLSQGDKTVVLSAGSNMIGAYELETGKEVWKSEFNGYSLIPKPLIHDATVYVATGYDRPQVQAIRIGGTGDITKTARAWDTNKAAPHTPSMLIVDGNLYMVSDGGILTCLDAKSGEIHWSERIKGKYSASLFAEKGKIYATSEEGNVTIVAPGKNFEVLSEIDLKERTFASFGAVDGALFVRTESKLYCFKTK